MNKKVYVSLVGGKMEGKGVIKKVIGNKIIVNMYKETACSHCNACSEDKKISREFEFTIDKPANIGDIITFEIDPKNLVKTAAIAYMFPAVAMIAGYLVAFYLLHQSENKSILFSFISLVVAFFIVFLYDKIFKQNNTDPDVNIISIEKP